MLSSFATRPVIGRARIALIPGVACLALALTAATAQAAPDHVSIYAGNGSLGNPTPGPALSSRFTQPRGEAIDHQGNLYIADYGSNRIAKVTPAGDLTVFAGSGAGGTWVAGPATASPVPAPVSLAIDSDDNVYIGTDGVQGIAKVTQAGQLSILGSGVYGTPVNGPQGSSPMEYVYGLAIAPDDTLYFSNYSSYGVFKITPAGTLSRFAGTGTQGAPIPGPATSSPLAYIYGMALDSHGNLLISDTTNQVVEKVTPGGTLTIFAGTGSGGAPVAGPATASPLWYPRGIAVDADDNVYIADQSNNVVERVTPDGNLTIFAGTGTSAAAIAGPPLSSPLSPYGLAIDADGALYVRDGSYRIVKIGWAPPAPPSALAAAPQTTSFVLNFAPPADPGNGGASTSYDVSLDGGDTWQSASTTADAGGNLTTTLQGLAPNRTYSVMVRGRNVSGAGLPSLALSVTTLAETAPPPPTPQTPPTAPTATTPPTAGPKSCRDTRTLAVHWIVRKRDRLTRVTISVNGKRVRTVSGKARTATIRLSASKASVYRIRIDATTTTGGKLASKRIRGLCGAKPTGARAVSTLVLKPARS